VSEYQTDIESQIIAFVDPEKCKAKKVLIDKQEAKFKNQDQRKEFQSLRFRIHKLNIGGIDFVWFIEPCSDFGKSIEYRLIVIGPDCPDQPLPDNTINILEADTPPKYLGLIFPLILIACGFYFGYLTCNLMQPDLPQTQIKQEAE
jgi:hypothetical protein